MAGQRAAFWVAVGAVSLISPVLFNLAADSRIGETFPGLRTLNDYVTRKNG